MFGCAAFHVTSDHRHVDLFREAHVSTAWDVDCRSLWPQAMEVVAAEVMEERFSLPLFSDILIDFM